MQPNFNQPRPQSEEEALLGSFLYSEHQRWLAEAKRLEAADPVKYKGYYGRIEQNYHDSLKRAAEGQNTEDAFDTQPPAPTQLSPWKRLMNAMGSISRL